MASENSLRYLKFDYQGHKDALLQRVRERFPSRWNDFLSNSFGIVLVDAIAFSTASLAFLVNRVAGENFIGTMTLRESAVRQGALVGYQLRNPIPASVSCEAVLSSTQTADVLIQKGTLIRTSDTNAIPFETAADYTIEAGQLAPKTLILTLSPSASGANVVNSFVKVTAGAQTVDLVDTTVDLSQFVEAGQSFNKAGSSAVYTIQGLETSPGSVSEFTRIVLDRAYAEATETIEAEVYDLRIVLAQGQTVVDRFIAPAINTLRYTVKLSRTPVIDNSVEISVNGEPWTQVGPTDFREAEDKVYQVKILVSGETLALFGDDSFGAAVPGDAAIEVTYRVGGGSEGNIDLNTINTSITGLISTLNSPISITVTNSSSTGQGGRSAETLEEARNNIPVYTRNNNRAVTLGDYQSIASLFSSSLGSVAFARSTIRRENSFLEGNQVVIYAWTTGSSGGLVNLSAPLKQALRDYVQTKAIGTDLVQIFDGTSRPVPVSMRFKTLGGFNITDTRSLLSDTLRDFINALRPGDTIQFSDLMRRLDEVFGVDNVDMATPLGDLIPSNDTELFTPPQDSFEYEIERTGFGSPVTDADGDQVSNYAAQLPIFPLQTWSMQLFLGVNEVTIIQHSLSGFARLFGENISDDDAFPSTVNLLTGEVSLWLKGAPGDLTMKLITVQGYSQDRPVNVYIGYVGENTLTKRRQIRAALRSWSDGLTIGGPIYAQRVAGIAVSRVSITDVVEAIDGVDRVTRVALDTPANNEDRITAADYELLRLGNITLNNAID